MSQTTTMPIVGSTTDPPRIGMYQSRMVERYRSFLTKCEDPQILDIGPICGQNIDYLINRYTRIHVCDLVQRLAPEPLQPIEAEAIVPWFDYDENSFDGIHLWDVPDHLDDRALKRLVALCSEILKPNGLLMVIAGTTSLPQPYQHYVVIGNDMMVRLMKSTSFRLPYFHRSNRDIEIAMKPFEQYCSFVCMNGIREFLFKKVY
jgi:hypothetical protein